VAGLAFTGDIGSTYRIEPATTWSDATFWQTRTTLTIDYIPYLFVDIEPSAAVLWCDPFVPRRRVAVPAVASADCPNF
jgi:hypothetical protein